MSFRITLFFSFLFLFTSTYARIEDQDIQNMDEGLVIERIAASDIEVVVPKWIFFFSEAEVKLKFKNPQHTKLLISNNTLDFIINGESSKLNFDKEGQASFKFNPAKGQELTIFCEEFRYTGTINVVPSWAVIVPIVLLLLLILKRMMRKKS